MCILWFLYTEVWDELRTLQSSKFLYYSNYNLFVQQSMSIFYKKKFETICKMTLYLYFTNQNLYQYNKIKNFVPVTIVMAKMLLQESLSTSILLMVMKIWMNNCTSANAHQTRLFPCNESIQHFDVNCQQIFSNDSLLIHLYLSNFLIGTVLRWVWKRR